MAWCSRGFGFRVEYYVIRQRRGWVLHGVGMKTTRRYSDCRGSARDSDNGDVINSSAESSAFSAFSLFFPTAWNVRTKKCD